VFNAQPLQNIVLETVMNRFTRSLLVLLTLALSSCAGILQKQHVENAPGFDAKQISPTHVVKLPKDERGVHQLIVADLNRRGVTATTGTASERPASAKTYITYKDNWMWDITMYMLRLEIRVYDAKTNALLSTAMSERTSAVRKSPEGMIQEVLNMVHNGRHIR
jgi:hypothetical protein